MTGYVVSRGGTFGVVDRAYKSDETGEDYVVISWGPLGWKTPVRASDCHQLRSAFEDEASAEAEQWMEMCKL